MTCPNSSGGKRETQLPNKNMEGTFKLNDNTGIGKASRNSP